MQEVNKMTSNNLAVVIGPNALRKRGLQADSLAGDSTKVISIFECLIKHHETVQSLVKVILHHILYLPFLVILAASLSSFIFS